MRSGVIQVTGLADPAALGSIELGGFGIIASGGSVRRIAQEVAAVEGVRYVAAGFGRFDLVGRAEAGSTAHLVGVMDAVRSVVGVRLADSWHVLDVVKESYAADLPDRQTIT
jgi:hypothetical protein